MTRYELVERIGSGGMAEIFRAKAIAAGGFEKPVAIKRILPHLSQDKRFVELLIAEANILSHLRHRNIVQIFDVGLGPDGHYFLVMEYVDGIDLGRLQEGLRSHNKRLPLDLALYIMCEVCEALEQAHSARGPDGKPMRLVHRDVSPSNVLLSRSGEAKLTDFGIAKRPEEVTGHGTVRGKFAYISPEQATNGHVDARSDVFSAGILLHELILGKQLFSSLPDFEALRAVREAQVPRLRRVDPAIPPELDDIVARALAKSPDDRYPGATEFGKELRGMRYTLPETSRDPAQELAGLVERFAKDRPGTRQAQDDLGEEKTVVRINSAAGFSLSGDYDESRHKSYADARQILDLFEEEITRSGGPSDVGRMRQNVAPPDDDSIDATVEAGVDQGLLASMRSDDDGEEATVVVDSPNYLATRGGADSLADNGPEERPTTTLRGAASEGNSAGGGDGDSPDDDEPTFMASFDELTSKPQGTAEPRKAALPPPGGPPGDPPGPPLPSSNAPLPPPGGPAGSPGALPGPGAQPHAQPGAQPHAQPGAPLPPPGGPGFAPGAQPGAPLPPPGGPGGPGGAPYPPGAPYPNHMQPPMQQGGPMVMYPGAYPVMGMPPRRRRWIAWGVGITATALLSFAIAAAWLDSGEASPPVPVDAGLPDAIPVDAPVPDAKPAKKVKRRKKRRRRRRKRRQRNRRRSNERSPDKRNR